MYSQGQGVAQDYVMADKWLIIADANGYKNAAWIRNSIAGKMTPSQIEKAKKLATEWMTKHR
jgi:TPR repeat protein